MIQPTAGGSALGTAPATESYHVLRILALVAVSLGVVVLAAAAFVLSYKGIRAVALEAGVSPDLARIYPLMFDVMLVVAGAAVLALRGAGWIVQAFAWLSLLVLLAAAAGASTMYATNTHLPHKTAATIAAILPWALALLGFFLLLAMLRHARLRRAQSRRATSAAAVAQQEADTIPGAVPSVLGAVPAAAAGEQAAFGADDNWPGGEYPNGRPDGDVRSPGQTTELAATGYPGDILVAGRPPADDPGADAPATDEPNADEPAAHETAADTAVPGAAVAGGAIAGGVVAGAAADEPPGTAPAGASAEAAGTTAGIPLRRPGGSGADEPETAESSLDSDLGQDDPVSDEAHPASSPGVVWVPRAREEPSAEVIRDEPEPSPAGPAEATAGNQQASTGAPETAAPEAADEGSAPAEAGPAGAATEPGQDDGSWFTPANGSAESAGAAPEQPGGAPGPAEQPANPPVTSFWDSVFGPRTPEGADQATSGSPASASEEQAEGHPATQPSETATADEEPQFDRFRSSPTPPDDE